MSVFSEDIIERNLEYLPDPGENLNFQLVRYFNKLCDIYNPAEITDIITYLKRNVFELLESLVNENTPDWWRGPLVELNTFYFTTLGDLGFCVNWRSFKYDGDLLHRLELRIDTAELLQIQEYVTKNWVL